MPAKAGIQGKGVANGTALPLGPGLRRGDDWLFGGTITSLAEKAGNDRAYSTTTRGKYIDTTQFGWSTIEEMRKSAQTLHSM